MGGPLVEATRGALRFTAPLTGITAAVVGVILNMALFFAWHVFWPGGLEGGFDPLSAIICAAAFAALVKWDANIIKVIGACGLVGLVYTLIR